MKVSTQDVLSQLLRHRTLQRRLRGAGNTVGTSSRYEVFSVAGPGSVYCTAVTLKLAQRLAETEAREQPGIIMSVWSPLRAHVYQATVLNNNFTVLHGPGAPKTAYFDTPDEVVDELIRYIETTDQLHSMRQQVEINMADLMAKGVYDGQNAVKAFIPVADAAVHAFDEQYGGTQQEQYPHDIRRMTAERIVALFEQQRREDPARFVEDYVEPQATEPVQQVIQTGDDDGRTIIINIGATVT